MQRDFGTERFADQGDFSVAFHSLNMNDELEKGVQCRSFITQRQYAIRK